ncbi:MAG: hypothetical protein L0H10_17110 [Comamonas sp.]|uniref:hypothetical protein n=1 Tax=Comamonas sp. TaxID=34028 RepID=UPI002648A01C|nr:hypothetical protein [Comamonas sp.]MDN5505511.1 hypothetical protein [Comamonas sp.]MDN5537742.1 hypothetical protein [Comamonas sp.]
MRLQKYADKAGKAAPAFPPLDAVNRPYVPTPDAAYYLACAQQTLREKHMRGTYDPRIRPIKIGNRLLWPVSGIKAVLGVGYDK